MTDENPPSIYPVHDTPEVDALRLNKNEARTRWRRTHVELDTASGRAFNQADAEPALEAHEEHLAALLDWKSCEASFIAARLGFRTDPPPKRR
ncbi:MAG: hypothetical protein DWI48_03915 [Chloroflexi bacterium]|nr:MAG: hypothetical protein DWI48_03915 [Chloroflexota bacterium]